MMVKYHEPGARPSDGSIPLSVPEIRGNEWRYVRECLDTGWLSSVGDYVDRFERGMAEYVGCRRAVATVNGTSALHVALRLAGVQPDDEVLVSDLTFIAPVNAIRYLGAWPVFIDAEATYWQLDCERAADFCERQCRWQNGQLCNRATGRRVGALLPVHVLGHPVDMDPLLDLARKFELPVIEDASESLGSRYKDRPVGSLGDVACFSYNGNKLITTGGGGMIVTNNEIWADKAKYLTTQAKDDPLEYIHGDIGYNYRLVNILAAIGVAQMEKLDEYIAIKRRIATYYTEQFRDVPGIRPMPEASWAESTFWMYTVLLEETAYGMGSRALLRVLEESRIQARPLWQPIHASPAYAAMPSAACPVADRLYLEALSLPCSVGLSRSDQDQVISAVRAGRSK